MLNWDQDKRAGSGWYGSSSRTDGKLLPSRMDACLPMPEVQLYRCVKCGCPADSSEGLRRHVTVEHLKWLPYECLYCDLFKATAADLTEHTLQSHPLKPVKLVVEQNGHMQARLEHLIKMSTLPGSMDRIREIPSVTVNLVDMDSSTRSPSALSMKTDERSVGEFAWTPSPPVAAPPPLSRAILPWLSEVACTPDVVDICADDNDETPPNQSFNQPLSREAMSSDATAAAITGSATPAPSTKQRAITRGKPCSLCGVHLLRGRGQGGPVKHVRQAHISDTPLVCKYCGKDEKHLSKLRRHIAAIHPNENVVGGIEDRRPIIRAAVDRLLLRCFGGRLQNSLKTRKSRPASRRAEPADQSEAEGANLPQLKARIVHIFLRSQVPTLAERDQVVAYPDSSQTTPVQAVTTEWSQGYEPEQPMPGPESSPMTTARDEGPTTAVEEAKPRQIETSELKTEFHSQMEKPIMKTETNSLDEAAATSDGQTTGGRKRRAGGSAFCRLCKRVVPYGLRHTQLRHLGATVFSCSDCSYRCNTSAAAVQKHHESDGCSGSVIDHSKEVGEQLAELHATCFDQRRQPPLVCFL